MSTWQPIETLTKEFKGQFVVYWRKSPLGGESFDMMGGWDEYQQILDFGEPPAWAWMPMEPPKFETGSVSANSGIAGTRSEAQKKDTHTLSPGPRP